MLMESGSGGRVSRNLLRDEESPDSRGHDAGKRPGGVTLRKVAQKHTAGAPGHASALGATPGQGVRVNRPKLLTAGAGKGEMVR